MIICCKTRAANSGEQPIMCLQGAPSTQTLKISSTNTTSGCKYSSKQHCFGLMLQCHRRKHKVHRRKHKVGLLGKEDFTFLAQL